MLKPEAPTHERACIWKCLCRSNQVKTRFLGQAPIQYDCGPSRRGDINPPTHREKSCVTEALTGVACLKPKEPRIAIGRQRREGCSRFPHKVMVRSVTLTSDFSTQNCEKMPFCCFQLPGLWSSVTASPGNYIIIYGQIRKPSMESGSGNEEILS